VRYELIYERPKAMASDEVEQARLDIERERLALDKVKAARDGRFLRANSGVLISAAVSFAALIVSAGQVWVTKISKEKELQVASVQKQTELEIQDKQKQKELAALGEEKTRDWQLNAARFVAENRKAIFGGRPTERRLFAQIIGTIYPPEVSKQFVERIETASPASARKIWRDVRNALETGTPIDISETEAANRALDTLASISDDLRSVHPARRAAGTLKMQKLMRSLERDTNLAPLLKTAEISSSDTDGQKILSGLVSIKRSLPNFGPLQDKVNRAINQLTR
jgi:hypothetical protein